MNYRTYVDLKLEVLQEADMEAEDFVQSSEVMTYFKDAVREAASHIYKLGLEDDYFKSELLYSLTNGQTYLAPPSDIYANKISALLYSTPDKVYPIKRLKGPRKEEIIQSILQSGSLGQFYQYDILNSSPATGPKIMLYPPSQEARTDCILMRYIRAPEVITGDASYVDIPEFYSFVKAFVKYKLFDKENSVKAAGAKADYEKEKQLMLETLAEMTPDYDSNITPDISIYEEMT